MGDVVVAMRTRTMVYNIRKSCAEIWREHHVSRWDTRYGMVKVITRSYLRASEARRGKGREGRGVKPLSAFMSCESESAFLSVRVGLGVSE